MSKKEAAEKIRFYSFLSRKDRGRVKAMWVNQKKKKRRGKKERLPKIQKKNEGDVIHSTIFFLPIPFFPPSFLLTSYTDGKSINRNLNLGSKTMKKKKKDKKKNKRFKIPPPLLSNTTSIYHSQAQ